MARPVSICHACGTRIQRKNPKFCPQCQAPLNDDEYKEWIKAGNKPMPDGWKPEPTPVPEPEPKNEEDTTMDKNNTRFNPWWIIGLIAAIIAAVLITLWVNNTEHDKAQLIEQVASLQADRNEQVENSDPVYVYVPADTVTQTEANAAAAGYDTSGKVTEQDYLSHPRYYQETGIEGTKTFKNIVVYSDEYLIVGGVSVDGTDNGVYRGYGPGTYTIKVTDGFVSIVDDDWGAQEFDFRVNQAIKYGWAHAHIDRGPISE